MAGKLIRNLIAVWRGWGGALSFMLSVDFSLAETISWVVGEREKGGGRQELFVCVTTSLTALVPLAISA